MHYVITYCMQNIEFGGFNPNRQTTKFNASSNSACLDFKDQLILANLKELDLQWFNHVSTCYHTLLGITFILRTFCAIAHQILLDIFSVCCIIRIGRRSCNHNLFFYRENKNSQDLLMAYISLSM